MVWEFEKSEKSENGTRKKVYGNEKRTKDVLLIFYFFFRGRNGNAYLMSVVDDV